MFTYELEDEYLTFIKESIKEHIFQLLDENNGKISLMKLFEKMIHINNHYLAQKLRIDAALHELELQGIIEIKNKQIRRLSMGVFDETGFKEEYVKNFYEKRKKDEEIRRMIRALSQTILSE
ncbi:MAG: hypothetical protein K9W45_13345 [Candidatus Heimdallarchaeum aukensis]|uniref:Uncharacterized protein n=1 Tax=Candidatus Heimdallarchaeum aukensis TaxID=2876573 RepID=A0A9Y1BKM9_9ARCH|nr:MAG: hypothetical protein K9W45_13345 [Candidatus Heimdallarchaeum aukensis]